MSEIRLERWPRLRALLEQALDLEPDARARYLDALSESDPDMHRDLGRMIDEHELLSAKSMPSAIALIAPEIAQSMQDDEDRVGQSIGHYRLVRLLGAGGMGAVYLAERLAEGFAQTVALKVVQRTLGSQVARERFERERQILSGLKHPGIALLFDGGQTVDGQSFYTMEYVDGAAIHDYCERRAESVSGRVRLLLQVATTLAYAHLNLVVHRDIKPSNVLVTAEGSVKLVDFGVAKLLDQHSIPTVTQLGPAPMTLAYAAPEQFLNGATTVATDIYQFGVLCFVVLTGCLPYRADPHDTLSWARAVTEEEPMTLQAAVEAAESTVSSGAQKVAAQFKRQLTRDLDAIVRKAMAKNPDARYRSMDAMIADLDAFLSGRPVTARPVGPLYFTWRFLQRRRHVKYSGPTGRAVTGRFLQRRRRAVAAAVLAAAAIGTGAGIAWRQSHIAAENAERAAREAEIRSVTRAMLTDLLRAASAGGLAERPKSALEALDQGAERTLRVLSANSRHRAIAAGVLAESYLELHHPQRARALIEQTLPSLAGDGRAEIGADILQLDLLFARAAADLGDVEASQRALARAEAAMDASRLPSDEPRRLAAGLAHVLLDDHAGRAAEANELAARLLVENDRPGTNETLEFAEILRVNAANSMDNARAGSLAERAWKIVAQHYGEDSPAALAAQRLMLRYIDTDSERIFAAQETQLRDAFGEGSLDYAEVLNQHCLHRLRNRDYAGAEPLCRQAEAIYENSPDSEATQLATAHEFEGDALLHLGRPDEALARYESDLAVRLVTFAPNLPIVIHTRLKVAEARCLSGDVARASADFDTQIEAFVALVGPRHLWEAIHAARFADCLLDAGQVDGARRILERHGSIDPPRKDMSEGDRAEVAAAWERLPQR